MKYIKIHGLQRCGTNYTEWLIANNFNVKVFSNVMGWKHLPPPKKVDWNGKDWPSPASKPEDAEKQRLGFLQEIESFKEDLIQHYNNKSIGWVCCTKHPYSWYQSAKMGLYYRGYKPADMIKHYNKVNNSLLNQGFHLVRYEDYYERGFQSVLEEIKRKFKLEKTNKEYIDQEWVINPNMNIIVNKKFDPKYYEEKQYLNIPENLSKIINKNIDHDLIEKLNYELI